MADPIPQPIETIAEKLSIPADALLRYGADKAKLSAAYQASVAGNSDGKLVLVTAVTPTRYGEGKTTTTIGLGDALSRLGQRTVICLREPSLGPVFGQKGGGTGGGVSRMIPSDEINLHFTGDIHAISAAHNLLAAMTDNHLYWGTAPELDARRIVWRRVMDMNDRALRQVVISLGGVTNGFAREGNFDITAASEIMAILCLASDLDDLQRRLGDIVVGHTRDRKPVTARDLKADGAMAVLLKDAFLPNLVQTGEGTPTIVHGGPFANIAHGCNSVVATRLGLKLGDIVVTEAGFGADLGAEKFLNIKTRTAGLRPSAAVLVATVRALKSHGDISPDDIDKDDPSAVKEGLPNLGRHIENMQEFGLPVVVAINKFGTDSDAEVAVIKEYCASIGVEAFPCTHFADGGAGIEQLAGRVIDMCQAEVPELQFSYELGSSLLEKLEAVATRIYRARGVSISDRMRATLEGFERDGWSDLPVCIAKTQYSFSADPTLKGAPEEHVLAIREVYLNAGAGFIVAVCGDLMRMPGLPRVPAAVNMGIKDGKITGVM